MQRTASIIVAVSLAAGPAAAQTVPASLDPPPGTTPAGRTHAEGVQIYVCAMKDGALAWTFKAPDADLKDAAGRPFAHHFAGPTWQASDGSKVVGKLVASVPAPTPGAIPWLLLSATATGSGVLAGTRFVQRVDTVGGVGPKGACPSEGATKRVAYSATYVFFR